MLASEVGLACGALAFYLFDATQMLYGDELLYVRSRRGWHCLPGGEWLLFRRRLVLPNPLTPQAPVLRVRWSESSLCDAQPEPGLPGPLLRALRPIQAGVVLLLVLIAVALPLTLLRYGQSLPLLWLFAAIYLLAAGVALIVWRRRAALGLTPARCAALSVDLLACPPFGINVLRKITLQHSRAIEPLRFARQAFSAADYAALCAVLVRRVDAELAAEVPDQPRYRALRGFRERLDAAAAAGQGA